MTTPDPNMPVQQVGETAFNFQCRMQQYSPPTTGPNQSMARAWLAICAVPNAPAPSGFTIR